MNVAAYLSMKYGVNRATTITYREAKVLGIPYPLRRGWLSIYGVLEVTAELAEALAKANAARPSKNQKAEYREPGKKAAELAQKQALWNPRTNVRRDSVEFLKTYEWRRVRFMALKASNGRCQACGASRESGAELNVDHIKPRALFPALALDLENLQVLCSECNHGKGNWDMTDFRATAKADK